MTEAGRRGDRLPYRLSATPLGVGGFAEVFRAERRADGAVVALKRARSVPDAAARLRREIVVQRTLAHPNIMPILDFDPAYQWFVMPLADGNLVDLRRELDEEDLAALLLNVVDALEVAHTADLVHRDITPANVLALPTPDKGRRWVIADWGLVHRPSSESTPPITKAGQGLGTEGFAAPEVWTDAATATPAADVYSVGRVVTWFLTGVTPTLGQMLLPEGKYQHWRGFVRACTEPRVEDRIQTVDALRERFRSAFKLKDEPPELRAVRLLDEALAGESGRLHQLAQLALDHDNDAIFIDSLAQVPTGQVRVWAADEPELAARVGQAMARRLSIENWGNRDTQYMATPLTFVLVILSTLLGNCQEALGEDLAEDYFLATARCQHAPQRVRSVQWLEGLNERAGIIVARAIAPHPQVIAYLRQPHDWQSGSRSIRSLLSG